MTAHYRSPINFTWESLQNAQNSLKKLYDILSGYKESETAQPSDRHMSSFLSAINDDLNMPEALAVCWDMLKSNLTEPTKLVTALSMDKVLGLRLEDAVGYEIPQNINDLARTRQEYRRSGIWEKADIIRRQMSEQGYYVEDLSDGNFKVKRKIN
jgi:cysteinyl-tRNA synthetase